MEDHIKNVAQESAQTKQLCDRRQKEVESQEHQIVLGMSARRRPRALPSPCPARFAAAPVQLRARRLL